MRRVTPFLIGLLFGLGLCLAGMTNAAKVLGFLDLAGAWDPSLAFVMGGAIAVAFPAFRVALRRGRTFSDAPLDLPTLTAIDGRLIGGSLLFGVGWGWSASARARRSPTSIFSTGVRRCSCSRWPRAWPPSPPSRRSAPQPRRNPSPKTADAARAAAALRWMLM